MKLLADMGVSMSTVEVLREKGCDVVHLREQGLQHLADDQILKKAFREGRVVLTFDLDFGDLLAAELRAKPSIIIFRLRDPRPASVNARLTQVLAERSQELRQGVVLIVEEKRYRMRLLPIHGKNGEQEKP